MNHKNCSCSYFDSDTCRWQCLVTGNECIYIIPNSDQCKNDGYYDSND